MEVDKQSIYKFGIIITFQRILIIPTVVSAYRFRRMSLYNYIKFISVHCVYVFERKHIVDIVVECGNSNRVFLRLTRLRRPTVRAIESRYKGVVIGLRSKQQRMFIFLIELSVIIRHVLYGLCPAYSVSVGRRPFRIIIKL